jgi:hypothetical protein
MSMVSTIPLVAAFRQARGAGLSSSSSGPLSRLTTTPQQQSAQSGLFAAIGVSEALSEAEGAGQCSAGCTPDSARRIPEWDRPTTIVCRARSFAQRGSRSFDELMARETRSSAGKELDRHRARRDGPGAAGCREQSGKNHRPGSVVVQSSGICYENSGGADIT